jgi:hypothetical protein
VPQVTTVTPNDFTNPVLYTVTAADGTMATYTVIVTVASNSAKAIAPYTLAGVSGIINEAAKTIAVTMPSGTNVIGLIAAFTSTGTGLPTPNDFTNPVLYTVTAADGTTATYTVTVTVTAANPGPAGAVNLGIVAPYGVIANSAITLSAPLAVPQIYGDVAEYAGDTLTGFAIAGAPADTSPRVTGVVNTTARGAVSTMPALQIALTGVYDDLSARGPVPAGVPPAVPVAGAGGGTFLAGTDLSGMRLGPGIYQYAAGASALSSAIGPLVLDAGGNPDAVFIIRAATIVTTSGSVVLQGGAQPNNIYWVSTGAALIGDGTSKGFFQGTLVSGTDITLNVGINAEGRMLAGAAGAAGALTVTGGTVITVPQ